MARPHKPNYFDIFGLLQGGVVPWKVGARKT
jgi:hypothetical protein